MKTLFLAEIHLTVHNYMSDSVEKTETRIIWAQDDEAARALINETYEIGSQYSAYQTVDHITLTEALGSPD